MTSDALQRIVLVGTGNVASHLGAVLAACAGYRLVAVANRTETSAMEMAGRLGCGSCALEQVGDFMPDIVIVSVADSAIATVVRTIGRLQREPVCLLTSGTMDKEILSSVSGHVGVLYPLQTFTKGVPVNFSEIPVFTEASDPDTLIRVDALAASMGVRVYHADASRRQLLHIAGVFANNFVNVLLGKAEQILASDNLPPSVIEPLVKATVAKAFAIGADAAQTGPARRGDREVMERQLQRLPENLKPAYIVLSKLITEKFQSEK